MKKALFCYKYYLGFVWFTLFISLINFSFLKFNSVAVSHVSFSFLSNLSFLFLFSCDQLSASVNYLVNFCSGPYQLYYPDLPHQVQVRASLNILIRLICKWIFPAKIIISSINMFFDLESLEQERNVCCILGHKPL